MPPLQRMAGRIEKIDLNKRSGKKSKELLVGTPCLRVGWNSLLREKSLNEELKEYLKI